MAIYFYRAECRFFDTTERVSGSYIRDRIKTHDDYNKACEEIIESCDNEIRKGDWIILGVSRL